MHLNKVKMLKLILIQSAASPLSLRERDKKRSKNISGLSFGILNKNFQDRRVVGQWGMDRHSQGLVQDLYPLHCIAFAAESYLQNTFRVQFRLSKKVSLFHRISLTARIAGS